MKVPEFSKARIGFLCEALRPERITRIVDIGANPLGEHIYQRFFNSGFCEIWGFEPQQSAYDNLIHSARANQHYLPYAIGSGEMATLKICAGSGFTSLLEPNVATFEAIKLFRRNSTVIERLPIMTHRLDDIVDLPEFDMLKIDIQGGETTVFQNGNRKLSTAVAVITEVAAIPLYVNQPLLDDQMRALRALGFDLHKFIFMKSIMLRSKSSEKLVGQLSRSQLIDGDAVFLRGLLDFPALNPQQLRHQAILADAVYGSYDLVVQILDYLVSINSIPNSVPMRYLEMLTKEG